MGNCLVLRHGYTKTKFGIITPTLVKQQRVTTMSFVADEDALYIVSANVDGSTKISSISVANTGSIKYSSANDVDATGGCAIIALKSDEACSITFTTGSSSCIIAKLPIVNADIILIDTKFISSSSTLFNSNIVMNNGQNGGLYLGVSNGGKHNGYISSVYEKTNCDGDKLTYSPAWDMNTIGTFIPNSNSNNFTIGTSLSDPQGAGGRQTSSWLFKIVQKNIV